MVRADALFDRAGAAGALWSAWEPMVSESYWRGAAGLRQRQVSESDVGVR